MIELLLVILTTALIYLFLKYSKLSGEIETRAMEKFEEWKKSELERYVQALKGQIEASAVEKLEKWKETELKKNLQILFEQWRAKEEKRIREEAIKKSEAVIRGKVTEHLIPFLPGFKYNPKDARFIGTPVDFIIFDGLDEGNIRKIVFVEIKTGKNARLSERERLIKKCVEDKNVEYEIIHRNDVEHKHSVIDAAEKGLTSEAFEKTAKAPRISSIKI